MVQQAGARHSTKRALRSTSCTLPCHGRITSSPRRVSAAVALAASRDREAEARLGRGGRPHAPGSDATSESESSGGEETFGNFEKAFGKVQQRMTNGAAAARSKRVPVAGLSESQSSSLSGGAVGPGGDEGGEGSLSEDEECLG